MKPLLLQLQAFGPFAHLQKIDFTRLGANTFFLIHGPTGAGKTSILDGICFALFGDSSGGERDARQMRSHHADGDTLTEVSFSFALGPTVYRVRRVPEQPRKAKRGDREAKQTQIAELCRIDTVNGVEVEHPLTSGWTKVSEAVVELLGFESQQFRQVIMLPQGKFFEFLKSSSQERENILQTLFGTELYKRIEEQLKLAASELSRQSESLRTKRQTLLDQSSANNEATLDNRLLEQTEDLSVRRQSEKTSAEAALAVERVLAEARRFADRFEEFDKASGALHTLRGQEPGWALKRSQLGDARRAATIEPHAAAVVDLSRQMAEEEARGKSLAAHLTAANQAHVAAEAALKRERERAPEIDQTIKRIEQLDALGERVAALAIARKDQAVAAGEAAKTATAQRTAQEVQKVAAEALRQHTEGIQAHRLQAAEIDGLKGKHARLATVLGQSTLLASRLGELTRAKKQVDEAQSRLKSVEALAVSARAERDRLRSAWLSGQAVRLAHELVDGEPCSVCGATDHPAPAMSVSKANSHTEFVSDETLKAAETEAAKVEKDQRDAVQPLTVAQQAVAALDARVSELRSALGSDSESTATDFEALKAQVEAASLALKQAEKAAKSLLDGEIALPKFQLAFSNAEAAAKLAVEVAQTAQASLQRMAGQLAERETGIPPDLSAPAALTAARTLAAGFLDSLRKGLDTSTTAAMSTGHQLTEATTRVETSGMAAKKLAAQHADKVTKLDEQLTAGSFGGVAAFRAALMDTPSIKVLEQDVRAFDAALAAAAERHSRATEATRALIRPDLVVLSAQHEAAKVAHLAASNAVRDAMAALSATSAFAVSLKNLAAEYLAIEGRYAVLKQVSDVAGGANVQRMSFQRYVLATLLEEVLVATTQRLQLMSRGRYEMRRKQQASDQRAAAGLDLEVFDHYTGTNRPVSTLSGGESFLASLALALGLSDVVQSYAGGIRLDAIFVDEGFGTLDPESLDFAIRALQDLQQAGRMVGIISHVAELKEWIPARLELKATQAGSVAEFVL